MALTDIYTLLPQIQPYLTDCPENVVKQWLVMTARDFVIETGIWRESLATVSTVEDQAAYTLSVTAGYEATIGRILEVKVEDVVRAESKYTFGPSNILTFDPAPNVDDDDIDIKVVYWPTVSCYQYPDWLVTRWQRGLVAGCLRNLKLMSDRPWGDKDGAMLFDSMYQDWIGKAKEENLNGRQSGNISVRLREFY
jgi:hypothetical protein